MCIASWQLATFGITIGYHRCWSHRAFVASFPLRCVLAGMGCLGFQGSIKYVLPLLLSDKLPLIRCVQVVGSPTPTSP